MKIGQKIKKARLEKGYTQEELANIVGVKKSAVAKWENGRVSEIKRSNLSMLASALSINPNELLDDIQEKPVDTANELADIYFDSELMNMIREYNLLSSEKKAEVRQFVTYTLRLMNAGRKDDQ